MNSAIGALLGLALAIVLIIRKISPVYSLLIGAFVGGLAGGFGLTDTVNDMVSGVKDMTPAIVRILAAGILSGVLVKTGAASSISLNIIGKLGKKHVLLALALSVMLLTAVGVFIDVAVITVAPIALMIGRRLNEPKYKLLLAMVGGGKCGNIISPNPNTIIAAENFNAPLSSVMFSNIAAAVAGLIVTVYVIIPLLKSTTTAVDEKPVVSERRTEDEGLPSFWASMTGPIVAIALLALRPLAGISVDPMIALPIGGLAGLLCTHSWHNASECIGYGLEKMSVVAVLLVGTGAIAGIIKASSLTDLIVSAIGNGSMGDLLLAPIAGTLMSAATASTTAGATIASASFAGAITASGTPAVWGAAMVNAGATVLDHLPHGSFFHATGGSVEMAIIERLKLMPYETAIGLVLSVFSVISYVLMR